MFECPDTINRFQSALWHVFVWCYANRNHTYCMHRRFDGLANKRSSYIYVKLQPFCNLYQHHNTISTTHISHTVQLYFKWSHPAKRPSTITHIKPNVAQFLPRMRTSFQIKFPFPFVRQPCRVTIPLRADFDSLNPQTGRERIRTTSSP